MSITIIIWLVITLSLTVVAKSLRKQGKIHWPSYHCEHCGQQYIVPELRYYRYCSACNKLVKARAR